MDVLDRARVLYTEKNEYLSRFGLVDSYEFYREIFPEGSFERKGRYEDRKGNGIAVEIQGGSRVKRYTVTDDLAVLSELKETDFSIISPISYYGNSRCGKNARYLYALAFDLDGVDMPQLKDTVHQMGAGILPKATFVVNSGMGLHLYYVLNEPVPMYPDNQKYLKELKYALTRQIWNRYTSTIKHPQIQGILQGFRVVGSASKLGKEFPVVAFHFGEKVDLCDLLEYVPESNGERQRLQSISFGGGMSLSEAMERYPDWYERRVVKRESRGRWIVNRALYDWWLRRISDEIRVGHRYYAIMTLAIYAKKCDIAEDELRRDAYELLPLYDSMSYESTNRFVEDDVICALEMFNEDYVTFPRRDIEKLSGISIPANKRNWRKRKEHVMLMNFVRDKINGNTDWRNKNGRPVGSGTAQAAVSEWRMNHPDGCKADCRRDTGLDPKTIRKWWDGDGIKVK